MFSTIPMTIIAFAAALCLTFFALSYLLVEKWPRSTVFWRRSDYVYFAAAILAATLGILEQSARELEDQIVQASIERNEIASGIGTRLVVFDEECHVQADRLARERERREGIIRPDEDTPWGGFTYETLSDFVCNHVASALSIAGPFLQDPVLFEKLRYSEDYAIFDDPPAPDDCAPFYFPPAGPGQELYQEQLVEPSQRIVEICEESVRLSEQLAYLHWFDPFQGVWPLLLGFAFGVRLTRVHADVNEALNQEARTQTLSQPVVTAIPSETSPAPIETSPAEAVHAERQDTRDKGEEKEGELPEPRERVVGKA